MKKTKQLSYCKYCKLPKHQCQCTSGEWSADYKTINIPCQDCMSGTGLCPKHSKDFTNTHNQVEDHQHRWEIDKLAGFIKTGSEGVYIICRSCGEVRLVEVNKPTLK